MEILRTKWYILFFFLAIIACKNKPDQTSATDLENLEFDEASDDNTNYHEPYPEYCVLGKTVNADPYSQEQIGYIKAEGHNRADINDLKINSFSATLMDYDGLEEAGIKKISIDVKVGHGEPKFKKGAYVAKPYSILKTENLPLPEIMVFVSDFDSSSTMEAVFQPDADLIRKSPFSTPEGYPPYLIKTASLHITHVEDITPNEDEIEEQKIATEFGMVKGKQYVKGTISFAISKFGPKGADFGPKTFSFGTVSEWAYFPNVSK